MFDSAEMAQQMVRVWRGDQTQLEASIALGWSSNVVGHWESGRRVPRCSTAFAMADRSCGGGGRLTAALSTSDWSSRPGIGDPVGVGLLLGDLVGQRPIREVAAWAGKTEATLHRWLCGQQEPNLVDFLRLLAPMGLDRGAVRALTNGQLPKTAHSSFHGTLTLLSLLSGAYRALPEHQDAWIARTLGLSPDTVRWALEHAQEQGAIGLEAGKWVLEDAALVGIFHKGGITRKDRQDIRSFAGRVLLDKEGPEHVLTGIVSPQAQVRLEAIAQDARRQVLELFAGEDTEGELVTVVLKVATLADGGP